MGTKKVTTTVYITEEQNLLLKELHRRTKVPVAEYIREGIDMVLDKHKANLPGQIDMLTGDQQKKNVN
jgi:Ribbon-helix-helix domain